MCFIFFLSFSCLCLYLIIIPNPIIKFNSNVSEEEEENETDIEIIFAHKQAKLVRIQNSQSTSKSIHFKNGFYEKNKSFGEKEKKRKICDDALSKKKANIPTDAIEMHE